jgi:hypothetical protein
LRGQCQWKRGRWRRISGEGLSQLLCVEAGGREAFGIYFSFRMAHSAPGVNFLAHLITYSYFSIISISILEVTLVCLIIYI